MNAGRRLERCEAELRFECELCREEQTAFVAFYLEDMGSGEDSPPLSGNGESTLICPNCGHHHDVSYDVFGNSGRFFLGDDKLITSDNVFVSPDPYPWLDTEISEDPFFIYRNSVFESIELLNNHGDDVAPTLINRMVFVHQFSAFEAYIADKMINVIKDDNKALIRLILKDKNLSDVKIPLRDIASGNASAVDHVVKYLRSIQYHNLGMVDFICRSVIERSIFENRDVREFLHKAISIRHDCVHRNGANHDGVVSPIITRAYVKDLSEKFLSIVSMIENIEYEHLFSAFGDVTDD